MRIFKWLKKHWITIVVIVFTVSSLASIIWFMFDKPFNDKSGIRDSSVFGLYGEFIGGLFGTIFTVAGFIVLYRTFIGQRTDFQSTIQQQRDFFQREAFERRFFEMVNIHRQNLQELSYTYYIRVFDGENKERLVEQTAQYRKVFKIMMDDFNSLENELGYLFLGIKEEHIYLAEYLTKIKSNSLYADRGIASVVIAKYDILYSIFFFGLSRSGVAIARAGLYKRYHQDFLDDLLFQCALKPKKEHFYWDKWVRFRSLSADQKRKMVYLFKMHRRPLSTPPPTEDLSTIEVIFHEDILYKNNYDKYYGGHQFRLGHYFRHLFQSVNYVNDASHLNYKEKYQYVKFLRAQFSTYEVILFFFNSLSVLGRAWEFEHASTSSHAHLLISKYNLIKNIHEINLFSDIAVIRFYPLVDFELLYSDILKDIRNKIDWEK